MKPARNYVLHLLHTHIKMVSPASSLDAGAGELRNYWMFPGKYVGIALSRPAYFLGLERAEYRKLATNKILPEVYLMRLESDFSFLGSFELCVSTFTLEYVQDRFDVVQRLSDRVSQNGSLIVEGPLSTLERHMKQIEPCYTDIKVVYWGLHGWDRKMTGAEFEHATFREIFAPNVAAGHERFYLFARGKKGGASAAGPRPTTTYDGGLFIVVNDIPYLQMEE